MLRTRRAGYDLPRESGLEPAVDSQGWISAGEHLTRGLSSASRQAGPCRRRIALPRDYDYTIPGSFAKPNSAP